MSKPKLSKTITQKYEEFFLDCISNHITAMVKDRYSKTDQTPPITYMLKDGTRTAAWMKAPEGVSPMNGLKPLINETKPECYVFCSEVWVSQKGKKKTERMIAICGQYDGQTKLKIHKIIRDKTKRIINVVEDKSDEMNASNPNTKFESTKFP